MGAGRVHATSSNHVSYADVNHRIRICALLNPGPWVLKPAANLLLPLCRGIADNCIKLATNWHELAFVDCQRTLGGEPHEDISGRGSSISTANAHESVSGGPASGREQFTERTQLMCNANHASDKNSFSNPTLPAISASSTGSPQ